ncbi:MAG: nucleotidyltransferase domain-containing protein, partial [archaeon]
KMKNKILPKLKWIEKKYNVKIAWAIESGSRAWGFESEDSDYDVRCMHIGKKEDYLGLFQPPAQISISEDELDIESWDIRKFSELTLKSNPQIAEWLRSPIIYRESEIRKNFKKLFDKGCSLEYLRTHYLRMTKQNYHKYMGIGMAHSCKKYLYVLRAIACAEYIKKENELPPLPYKDVIHLLPNKVQNFFEKCVITKNTTENAKITSEEETSKFIESHVLKNIPKKEHPFTKTKELNKYLVEKIIEAK